MSPWRDKTSKAKEPKLKPGRKWLPEEDLDPKDPRNRFIAQGEGGESYVPGPLTEEDKLEAAQ
jgi:hypothetical protein